MTAVAHREDRPPWVDLVELLVVGLVAGMVSGLIGVVGGLVLVPAMVLLLGFGQHLAQGTSPLAIIPAAIVGTYTHWRNGVRRPPALGRARDRRDPGRGHRRVARARRGRRDAARLFVVYLALTGFQMLLPRSTSIRALLTGSWRRGGTKALAEGADAEDAGPREGEP